MKCDRYIEEPALEPARDDECVAAVVARAREDEHARRAAGEELARGSRSCEPCALHERFTRGYALDRAQLRDATDRIESVAVLKK